MKETDVGRTALHYAALSGNTEIGELLLENGASANGIGGPHVPLSFSTTKGNGRASY